VRGAVEGHSRRYANNRPRSVGADAVNNGGRPKDAERELLDPRPFGQSTPLMALSCSPWPIRRGSSAPGIVHTRARLETRPMTLREKTALVLEVVFATALAFVVVAILYGRAGLTLLFALPTGELTWAAVILYFMS
jgi:hypothetical protein